MAVWSETWKSEYQSSKGLELLSFFTHLEIKKSCFKKELRLFRWLVNDKKKILKNLRQLSKPGILVAPVLSLFIQNLEYGIKYTKVLKRKVFSLFVATIIVDTLSTAEMLTWGDLIILCWVLTTYWYWPYYIDQGFLAYGPRHILAPCY